MCEKRFGMAFIRTISEEEATGKLKELYDESLKNYGQDTGVSALSLRPEVREAYQNLLGTIRSTINPRHYELATIATSSILRNSSWTVAHGAVLRANFFDSEQVEAIIRDYRNAELEPEEVALMAFAEKVTLHAYKVTQHDIDDLRSHGFSDVEILDIILAAACRNFISRVMDGVGWEMSPEGVERYRSLLGEKLFGMLMVGRLYGTTDEVGSG